MMLLLTLQQNDLLWSLNVEWIIKNPLYYGFLALFLLETVEAMDQTGFLAIEYSHVTRIRRHKLAKYLLLLAGFSRELEFFCTNF